MRSKTALLSLTALTFVGCGDDGDAPAGELAHTLFVAHEGVLASYEIATGEQRPGEVIDVAGPTDLQALEGGVLLVNLTERNEVLAIDGLTMLELARIPSSKSDGKRPVHSFIAPDHRYWLTLNDGQEGSGNSASWIDIDLASPTYLTLVGETPLGDGHHKAAFSATKQRVVISNIGDCEDVLSVYDYSDPGAIELLATLSAEDAGYDGSSFETTCDPTYQMGLPPAPHGCATSKLSGKSYCNLTSSGDIVAVDIDADPPSFTLIDTSGSGAGYTAASLDGRYIYTLQDAPREGDELNPGDDCQIGQLVVIDAEDDTVAAELPLFYGAADCSTAITGTAAETAGPGKIIVHTDNDHLFVATAGGFGVAEARVSKHLVVDVTDPTHPTLQGAVTTGEGTSHVGAGMSADGIMFTADNVSGSVTVIQCETASVLRTFTTQSTPKVIATFGSVEGPGYQTGPIH